MNYLIGGEANDAIKSAINNALLSKKNPSTQKSSIKIPSNLAVKDNSNNAAQVTISNLQALSQNLGLYNSKGIVPVLSVNKADEEISAKASIDNSGRVIDSLQALPIQFEQNNFKELNNTKKIQDNFRKEAVINPLAQSYYSDTNKIFTQAVFAQSNKTPPVVGNQNINLAEGQVKVKSNLNNQYLNISLNNKTNSILDKKPSTNHSGLADGSNPGQGLINSKNSNQGIDNSNKASGSPDAKLLNDFLKSNI